MFLQLEIDQVRKIVAGYFDISDSDIVTHHWNVIFNTVDLAAIQKYIKKHFVDGFEFDYTFVHSPNFIHKKESYQAYAEILWKYLSWLEKLENCSQKKDNWYPDIFKNQFAFQMYEWLYRVTVYKEEQAGYSESGFASIFYFMRENENLILEVTQIRFKKFMSKYHHVDFKFEKLKKRTTLPNAKKPIFEAALTDYHNAISAYEREQDNLERIKALATVPDKSI